MVNEEILGGLKLALAKGESLKQAMISFYNAGYIKEEIESAARALQTQQVEYAKQIQESPKSAITQKPVQTIKPSKQKSIQRISSYGQEEMSIQSLKKIKQGINVAIQKLEEIEVPEKIQKISNYEQQSNNLRGKLITFFLVFTLLFLLGVLAAVFLFKEELMEFFTNLFN